MDILFYLFIFALLALAAAAAVWVGKGYLNGQSPAAALFGPRPERRLGVIEQANVDGRRRLLLIRRDDVEHLVMTGGPVDVVIETGIGAVIGERQARRSEPAETVMVATTSQPVFARSPRTFGQSGERTPERTGERTGERVPERAAE